MGYKPEYTGQPTSGSLNPLGRIAQKKTRKWRTIQKVTGMSLIICLLFLLVIVVQASQQTYDLLWWTVDGGGGGSQNDSYVLTATIGQADAGTLYGENYSLAGGFWSFAPSAPIAIEYRVVLPLLKK